MTIPTTPSPERQPADAGGGPVWHRVDGNGATLLYTLRHKGFRRGVPVDVNDLEVRIQASAGSDSDPEPIIQRILAALEAPAPQAQPDARAWLVQEFNHDGVLRSEFAVVGDQPWSGERGADQITTQPLYLSAPAADDGWRDKAEGLESDLRSAVQVAWRRGAKEWARLNYPQYIDWLEACGDALHPAAPTDEVGK